MRIIILSGLPGSGKSHWVKEFYSVAIKENGSIPSNNYCVVSADDYFTSPEGKYQYIPSEIGKAHNQCLKDFLFELESKYFQILIVDNTNTSPIEIAPYYRIAEALGHSPEIIRIWMDPIRALLRNRHDVPLGTIMAMQARMLNEPLPSFWKVSHVIAEGPGS